MSSLLYRSDWDEVKDRLRAIWEGEALGRCGLSVTAPLADPPAIDLPAFPDDPVERWTNLDFVAALNEYRHATTFYGGEAFPMWNGGYPGHTSIPAFLGCPTELDMNTGWWEPILTDDDWDATELAIDPANPWWQFTLRQLDRAIVESAGKSVPDIGGALGGCGDTLAALRGTMELLYDVTLVPERVLEAELYLMDMWIDVYSTLYEHVHEAAEGSATWFGLWAPGKTYTAHCDFSYMISPEMFQRLFLPAIEKQTHYLDYTSYHVDGVGAFGHVPALLELPDLQVVQILPGAGKPSPLHYLDTLRLVQASGKTLHITIPPEEVETALELLSARNLFIVTHCEAEEQARHLLKMAEVWPHD